MSLSQNRTKLPVALLGATGRVGEKARALLADHPRFYLAEMAASEKRVGERLDGHILKRAREVISPYVLSALPAEVASEVEPFLAKKGAYVFSNASAFRMDKTVPNLIPEVNLSHLNLLEKQQTAGKIITNPNCTTVFITLALAPLLKRGMIDHVSIVTMQALSGGNESCHDTLIPYIPGEEEKIAEETLKILSPTTFGITVQVIRVPITHGHTIALHIHFRDKIDVDEVKSAYRKRNETWPGLYRLYEEKNRPQPALDINPFDQSAHIGQIKQGARPNILGLIVMGHNLVRGAAGAALRNMEETL